MRTSRRVASVGRVASRHLGVPLFCFGLSCFDSTSAAQEEQLRITLLVCHQPAWQQEQQGGKHMQHAAAAVPSCFSRSLLLFFFAAESRVVACCAWPAHTTQCCKKATPGPQCLVGRVKPSCDSTDANTFSRQKHFCAIHHTCPLLG